LTQKGDSSSRSSMSSKLIEASLGVDVESITDTKGIVIGFKLKNIVVNDDEMTILKLKFEEKFRSSFNII
jgi:NACalpha-BTF3-like transcription factor